MPRTQPNRKRRCSYSKAALKQSFLGIKTAASPINTGAASYNIHSKKLKSSRLSKVRITKNGEAASVKHLTNALGQRVFKGELRAQLQAQASLGSAFVYADGVLPSWAVLGEYDNGSASGAGRTEYIWLPTEDGGAVPVGMLRNSKFFAIHPDHLGTPRLMTDATATPVWQWPYSAFGHNAPVGVLKPTTSASGTSGNQAHLLASQSPAAGLDLRFAGQYADEEAGQFYNYFRTYQPSQGRYTQNDPIGLAGGLNRFGYAEGNPLSFTDPEGLLIMSTLGGVQRNTTLDQAATYGSPGNAATATGLAGSVGGAAVAGAGGAYRVYVPAAGRVAIGLIKGLRDDAMPPPMPPRPPLLNPPPIVRPGGFSPPAPPPGFCPRP